MRKKALLAMMMAAVMLLSGCTLIVKDKDVDNATTIVTVNDTVFDKATVQQAVNNELNNEYVNSYYMYLYGLSQGTIDITNPEVIAQARETAVQNLVETEVKNQKYVEAGLALSEQDEKDIEADAETEFNEMKESYQSYYFADTELEGEELDKAIVDQMTAEGTTMETIKESLTATKREEQIRDFAIQDVTVSEEEVDTEISERLAADTETYAEDLNAFVNAMNNGTFVYFAPEGVRAIQQILVPFTQEDKDVLSGIRSSLSAATSAESAARAALTDLGVEDIDALLGRVQVTVEDGEPDENGKLTAKTSDPTDDFAGDETVSEEVAVSARDLAKAVAEKAYWQDKLTAVHADAFAHIDEETDAILAQLAEGGDWEAIAAEKNADPGASQESYQNNGGYLVCEGMTSFDAAFVAAAMGLENIGDISEKTPCGDGQDYGYYILKYNGDFKAGEQDVTDAIRATVKDELLSEKQDATYAETVEKWVSEAKVTKDMKALDD